MKTTKRKVTYGAVNEMTAVCPKQLQVRVGSFACLERCKSFQGCVPESEAKLITHVNCSWDAAVQPVKEKA